MDESLYDVERKVLKDLTGRLAGVSIEEKKREIIARSAKRFNPTIQPDQINELITEIENLAPIGKYITDENIEDIMINNINNVFVYKPKEGSVKVEEKFELKEQLNTFVDKLMLYATNEAAGGNIVDVHMPTGSRVNIVSSPFGYDITIRNFRKNALSIIDLINVGTIDYQTAARLWIYTDGFAVRPANLLIGGMPASGKTTLLNSMFSFFRPETRVVTIEETYELNTETQDNCVRLETNDELTLEELVKNSLRMRPDMIIVGEVRGSEAVDMMTAMNIGKIVMCTIHASTSRDAITRLQNAPMNVPMQIIPAIDAIMITSQVFEEKKPVRRVVQMSEISGVETQVLLSDTFRFDYKTHRASPITPSVTYRDTIAKLLGVVPQDIFEEEKLRANMLVAMNKAGIRDLKGINGVVKEYYDNPQAALNKLGLGNMHPVIDM